jgi:hypothetical protein
MKLLKGLAVVAVVVVLAVGVGVWYLMSNLDEVVRTAIERAGSHATMTDVKIAKIGLDDLFEGKASVEGLSIGNPKGFAEATIFSLGKVSTHVDIENTSPEKVVINEIFIGAPLVTLEIDEKGNSNVMALKNNLERLIPQGEKGAAPAGADAEPTVDGKPAPKVVVKKLTVAEGKTTVRIAGRGGAPVTVTVPTFTMRGIGDEKPGGVPATVAIRRFLNTWIEKVNKAVAEAEVGKRIEELKARANEEIGKTSKRAEEQMKKEMEKNLGGRGKAPGEKGVDADALKSLF